MEITLKIDTQYGQNFSSQRVSDIRVLHSLAKALDETPVDVQIHSAPHNADRARENCAVADNVGNVSSVDVGVSFADVKGDTVEEVKGKNESSQGPDSTEAIEPTEQTEPTDTENPEDKPKRKRRTKKEMEASRAAEAADSQSAPVDEAIDAALKTLDNATGTEFTTEPTTETPVTEEKVKPANAMRDMMVKFVQRFGSDGTRIMAKLVEELTGETNILKVSEDNFGRVIDALNVRFDEPSAKPRPEATTEKDADLDY